MPKGLVPLAGVPLFVRSLRAVLAAPAIDEAIVVAPPQAMEQASALLHIHGPYRVPPRLVAGGAQRRDSVRHGLAAVERGALVAIHDAARPFVAAATVTAVIEAARAHGAAILAVPATDTIKIVDADEWIASTMPRSRVWLAQTPQVFRTELIRAAHARGSDDAAATDDATLVERLGHRVRVVVGDPDNRKITTPDDRAWAEWYLTRSAAPR